MILIQGRYWRESLGMSVKSVDRMRASKMERLAREFPDEHEARLKRTSTN